MDKHILSLLALAALLTIGIGACTKAHKEDTHDAEEHAGEAHDEEDIVLSTEQMKTVNIRIGGMELRNISHTLKANGQIAVNPQDMATVAALQGGVVKRIMVAEGQRVAAGQTVAYVENTEIVRLQQDYLTAQRQVAAARAELARQQALAAKDAGVKKTLEQAQTALAIAKVQTESMGKQLAQLGISTTKLKRGHMVTVMPVKTEIGGVVTQVMASTGSYTDMQQPLMTVVNSRRAYADIKVFQQDVASVRKGQEVVLQMTNRPDLMLSGIVERINPSLDEQTKAVSVHVGLKGAVNAALIPGVYVTAAINTGNSSTPALPADAIVSIEGQDYIFVLTKQSRNNCHFKKVKVKAGATDMGYTEVKAMEPLPTNARIAIANAFYISSMIVDHGEHTH